MEVHHLKELVVVLVLTMETVLPLSEAEAVVVPKSLAVMLLKVVAQSVLKEMVVLENNQILVEH